MNREMDRDRKEEALDHWTGSYTEPHNPVVGIVLNDLPPGGAPCRSKHRF